MIERAVRRLRVDACIACMQRSHWLTCPAWWGLLLVPGMRLPHLPLQPGIAPAAADQPPTAWAH